MIPPKQISQWRTWSGLLIIATMMDVALVIAANAKEGPSLLPSVIGGLTGVGLWLAGKSAVEHSANAKAASTAKEPAASILAGGAVKE